MLVAHCDNVSREPHDGEGRISLTVACSGAAFLSGVDSRKSRNRDSERARGTLRYLNPKDEAANLIAKWKGPPTRAAPTSASTLRRISKRQPAPPANRRRLAKRRATSQSKFSVT